MLCNGKLYSIDPGVIVRVKGQNLAAVHKYWIEKLRCALCGYIISADTPNHISSEKYDAAFKAILALQKYYVAIPFNRQAYFQSLLGVPLPASTQWQLIEDVGGSALLIFPTLERMAANGEVIHNGLRKFDDLKEFYPEPCIHIIELIAQVYKNDEQTRCMTKQERLDYHQQHSAPIMSDLKDYINNQLESKRVEPNDSLGKAMRYMLKHWHQLSQFIRIAGAPLDNNILERALKIPIRGRRTWLFYKTEYGAMIGGVLTSVIYTCALSGFNPLSYLIALQEHKNQIVKEPERWLPWCYQDTLATLLAA
jgi:hypothetical protein